MMEHFAIVVVAILSVGCTIVADESPFRITTKRDDDKVEVKVEKDKAHHFSSQPIWNQSGNHRTQWQQVADYRDVAVAPEGT